MCLENVNLCISECSATQECAKTFSEYFCMGVSYTFFLNFAFLEILSIFPSQPDIFVLRNHPFQVFLVSKTYTFIHEEEKITFFLIHRIIPKTRFQSVPIAALCIYKIQRENLVFKKSLCMSVKNVSFFGRLPL